MTHELTAQDRVPGMHPGLGQRLHSQSLLASLAPKLCLNHNSRDIETPAVKKNVETLRDHISLKPGSGQH
jgi:hypothetical protein